MGQFLETHYSTPLFAATNWLTITSLRGLVTFPKTLKQTDLFSTGMVRETKYLTS